MSIHCASRAAFILTTSVLVLCIFVSKSLKPSLARAADELRKAEVKNVVIATMDATENDAPSAYKAKGFPTMHFFPASDSNGEEYDGERTSKDIINFLVSRALNKFEFDTSKLGEDPEAKEEDEAEEYADMDDGMDADLMDSELEDLEHEEDEPELKLVDGEKLEGDRDTPKDADVVKEEL